MLWIFTAKDWQVLRKWRGKGGGAMCLFVCACVKEGNHELLWVSACTWCNTGTTTCAFSQRQKRLKYQASTKIIGASTSILTTGNIALCKEAKNGEVQVDPKWDYITQRYFQLLILIFNDFRRCLWLRANIVFLYRKQTLVICLNSDIIQKIKLTEWMSCSFLCEKLVRWWPVSLTWLYWQILKQFCE